MSVWQTVTDAIRGFLKYHVKIDIITAKLEVIEREINDLKSDINNLRQRVDHIYEILINSKR